MDYENDTSWVRGMLHPGENLLWTGRPGKGHLLRKEDIFLIPFSLIWCGFVVFWEYTALKSGAPVFFLLFGILFVLAGLFLTVWRFLLAAYRDRRTSYALTSERIIAQTGSTRKALELATLPRMSVIQRSDGTGDIRFGEMAVYGRMAGLESVRFHNQSSLMELRNIPDVNQVDYRIRTAADQAVRARRQEDR